jgi:uncharacterized protein (UPF0248 family)
MMSRFWMIQDDYDGQADPLYAFDVLNRLKWTGKLVGCEVVVVHRGASGGAKAIDASSITELKKTYFTYDDAGRERFIPFHRVREIRAGGKCVWRRPSHNRENA